MRRSQVYIHGHCRKSVDWVVQVRKLNIVINISCIVVGKLLHLITEGNITLPALLENKISVFLS